MCINPPLKDGLIGSFGLECQMYCPLAQWVVLNVVLLVPQPLLFLSKWLHMAVVASHPKSPGVSRSYSEPPDKPFDLPPKNMLFWSVPFRVFSQNRFPK